MKAFLSRLAALVALAAPSLRADNAGQPLPAPAHRAEDFVESMGLAASPFEKYLSDGPFKGAGTRYPPAMFFDLGVRHYRTGLFHDLTLPDQPKLVAEWYKKTGARPMLLVSPGKLREVKAAWMNVSEDGDFSALLDKVAEYGPGTIDAIEGPNEPNNKFPPQDLNLKYRGRTDEAAATAYQNDLFAALRGDVRTRDIPLVMYSAIFTDYSLGRPCEAFDFLNMHSYQGPDVPSSSLRMNIVRALHLLPDGAEVRPFMPTECGYNVDPDISNHRGWAGSLRAQAYNDPMLFAEYFRWGIPRAYLFALHNADGYGLLESDQETRRPAYFAVQSLVRLLADATWNSETLAWEGPGRAFAPKALRFTLENVPESVHSLTLQKADRTWYLLVWNEAVPQNGAAEVPAVECVLRVAPEQPVVCTGAWTQGEIPDGVPAAEMPDTAGAFRPLLPIPEVRDNALRLRVPARLLILALKGTDGGASRETAVSAPEISDSASTENSVSFRVSLPENHHAVAVAVSCCGKHIASIPVPSPDAAFSAEFEDTSSLLQPALGYRYAGRSIAADGTMSDAAEHVVQTAARRPDLVVDSFGPENPDRAVRPGDNVRFSAVVRNAGDGATQRATVGPVNIYNSSVAATFFVDGKMVGYGGDGGGGNFRPGATLTAATDGGPGGWTAEAGTHILKVQVDDVCRHPSERDRMNNFQSRTVTVGDTPGKLEMRSEVSPRHVHIRGADWLDWVAFDAWDGSGSGTRKPGAGLIGPARQTGKGFVSVNPGCAVWMSWDAEGDVPAKERSHSGLWGNCTGNGYEFTVPAGVEERVLKVYVGVTNGGRGEFSAELSDASAPAFTDTTWNANRAQAWTPVPGEVAVCYTLRYRAAKDGETLRVAWRLADDPNRFSAQIRLQAAMLGDGAVREAR